MIQFTFRQKGMKGPEAPRGLASLLTRARFKFERAEGPLMFLNDGEVGPDRSARQAVRILKQRLRRSKLGDQLIVQGQGKDDVFWFRVVETHEYKNPFRDAHISPARIDAGVDYCGTGPVYPIGPAQIVRRGTPSHNATFGPDLSSYRLTDGPAKGLVVFFAEHYEVEPGIAAGRTVDTDTPIYWMDGCIEIGWATDGGTGSKAWNETDYHEGQRSALGQNMSDLLHALGAPAGLTLGRPITGHLPAGWPRTWTL